MDTTDPATSSGTSSALPRLSRLPQVRPQPAANNHDRQTAIPARNSTMQPLRPPSSLQQHKDPLSPRKNRSSMLMKPGFGFTAPRPPQVVSEPRAKPDVDERPDTSDNRHSTSSDDANEAPLARTSRKPRPSLSDRTVETLAQIPPSPSPKRRQSGFYGNETPVRPPSRNTVSSMGFNRPYSRTMGRPPSPEKRTLGTFHGSKSSISARPSAPAPVGNPGSRLQQPKAMPTTPKASGIGAPVSAAKTLPRRTAARSPVKDIFSDVQKKPAGPARTIKPPTKSNVGASIARKAPTNGLRSPIALRNEDTSDESVEQSLQERKAAASSKHLREMIGKAKAARRSGANSADLAPRAVDGDTFANVGADADPSTFGLLDSGHVNILKKRISNAKSDGKLNIAALCLSEMPVEVLRMYEHDANGDSGSNWYENVDVTRLNAADNEFKTLPKELFPPVPGTSADDAETQEGIFASMELMDMHGNQLSDLPPGFGQLDRLTFLNLSRNSLSQQGVETVCNLKCLKELQMSENSLQGVLSEDISGLESLELLDVSKNQITELPSSLGKLSKLRTLNVSDNRLRNLPIEAIFDLPLVEILAQRNKLDGAFLPPSITTFPTLQTLDVSTNALLALSDGKVDFPNLRALNISFNRVTALPDVSNWPELTTLNAEENKISEVPTGFTSLKNLKHADFNFNSLLQLDDAIGSMESLSSFRVTNNPIRERRLLKLNITELKAELRMRSPQLPTSSDGQHSDDAASMTSFGRSPSGDWSSLASDPSRFSMRSPLPGLSPVERVGVGPFSHRRTPSAWTVTGDTLDVSSSKLRELDPAALAAVADQGVKALVAARNQISSIPAALQALAPTLTSLDLTNNRLGRAPSGAYLDANLALPHLATLNLTSNALTSLDPLVAHLEAPKLATLILLFNRLTSLPDLCGAYPALTKLLASNNAVEALEPRHVRHLQVLDLSSNELAALPPKLGLLQGQLRTLMVGGNKFKVPGWGIIEKGPEEILNWCKLKIPEGDDTL